MERRFAILDVFSDKPLAGNQLAVVLDAEGLSDADMQSIAIEFGYSETTFLTPANAGGHTAGLRIFTPANELPFAGHPTVGSAIIAGLEAGMDKAGHGIVVLEEKVGPVRCAVRYSKSEAPYAEFDLPIIAEAADCAATRETAAAALGLDAADIGFENHEICAFNGGVPYTMVPVRDLAIAQSAAPTADVALWREAFGTHSHNCAYLYCRETVGADVSFHARMFGPDSGILEDSATGSAVAAFAGAVMRFDAPMDGLHSVTVEQGIEMGRPSTINLEIDVESGRMIGGRIGGPAVIVARGTLFV
jgi:trans-2,3-dihydro-3-hydroxyanthranilate isomerase